MNTWVERFFDQSCDAIYALGNIPSVQQLPPRLHALMSAAELERRLYQWRLRRGDLQAERLCQAGFSSDLVSVFCRPVA